MTQIYNSGNHNLPIKQKLCFVLMSMVLLSLLSLTGYGQTTYNWRGNPGTTDSWIVNNSWQNPRNPASNDVLEIKSGGTVTLTNVPTQTIGRLIISNNTYAVLQASGNNTLTIGDGTSLIDLVVEAGSTLEINTNNALNIRLAAGATAAISGNIITTSTTATHTIDAVDAGAIVVNNLATFTQSSNGSVFTNIGTDNTVIFENGSRFISKNGSNPFGKNDPESKVTFKTGSTYSHQQNLAPSFSGRTYANVEINSAAYNGSSITGSTLFTADNFTVTNATNVNINLTGGINIRGDLTVNAGTVNFTPGSPNTITFNGAVNQIIGGSGGTLTFGANTTVSVPNNVTIQRDLTMSGGLIINGTLKYDALSARSLTVTGSITGIGTIDMSGGDRAHTLNLGGYLNTFANIISSSACNSIINYNRLGDQIIAPGIDYGNLTVSGTGTKTLSGNITVCKNLSVNSGAMLSLNGFDARVNSANGSTTIAGTLNAGTTAVVGAGSFTLTGTLITASPDGINSGTTLGSIRVVGTRTLAGGSFEFNGTVPQVTGNGLPTTVNNFTIANTGIIPTVALSNSLTINGAAGFTSGTLAIGSYTLTLNGTTTLGLGTISGGASSNLSIGGNNTLMLLPSVEGGLRNFTLNKTGNVTLPASGVTINNGGTLTLTNGTINQGERLTMGESATAITTIRRDGGSLAGTAPTFNNLVNVHYITHSLTTGTELPTSPTTLNTLYIGEGDRPIIITLNTDAVVNGYFIMFTSTSTSGLSLNGKTLTLNGEYYCPQLNNGVFIGSSTSSMIINGHNKSIDGTIRFSQTPQASRSLQNFILNRTGSGSAFTVNTYAEIANLNIKSGTLIAASPDIFINNANVEANGRFETPSNYTNTVTNTAQPTAFPASLPTSATTRAFNNNTANTATGTAFMNKFDRYAASSDAGNSISSNATDIALTRNGAGNIYAFRNKAFSTTLNTAVIRFHLGVVSTVGNTTAAGTLMIGSNLGDNATKPTATARLQFNLTTAGNKISVTSPDGSSYTSADNLDLNQAFTWVINNSNATISYTGPNGTDYNLEAGRCELWHNTSRLAGNLQIQNAGQAMNQIKFVMDNGTGTIRLRNLRINPLATIITNSIACFTAGYTLNVGYSATYPGTATPAAASFNEGNEFRVQLSDVNGNFNNNSLIIGGNGVKSTAATGTVNALIPAFNLNTNYRYRVISTDLAINVSTNNNASMYFTAPGLSQSMLPSSTGTTLTANTAESTLTGSITTSNSSNLVTGSGTSFQTQLSVGKVLKRASDNQVLGTIQSITSNTQLTLAANAISTNSTGVTFRASSATSFQWGYRTSSGSGFTAISGATSQTYTPRGIDLAAGNPGTYYVVCQINLPGCSGVVTNEVIIYINCDTGPVNHITNGRFDNTLAGTITYSTSSTTVTGNNTRFTTQLRVGRSIYNANNELIGTIASIFSDTQLTLTQNARYTGSSVSYTASYYQLQMAGTITTGTTTNIVNGTGTRFMEQVKVGDRILRYDTWGSVTLGTVASVTSNTQLTLTANASENRTNSNFRTNANSALYTGTITTNTGNNTVSGNGTSFGTEVLVGDMIKDQNNNLIGTVAAISNNTSLTLTTNAQRGVSNSAFSSNPASLGNSGLGFNTSYEYAAQDLNQGWYSVGTNPSYFDGPFCNITSSSTSSTSIGGSGGGMLIADAHPSETKILWSQTVNNLKQNTNYVLTFNAVSLYNPSSTNSLVFGMYLNCNRVGEDITAGFTGECNWSKYSIQVNSGTLTTFELAIANISANGNGNDIAIDDLEFYECSAVLTTPFAAANTYKWRGFSTNWFNSDNWGVCPGMLPTCGDDVEIPANAPNYPIINLDNAVARTVKIDAGGAITINADRNLNVCGDIINNGVITSLSTASSSARITFTSYGAANIPPSPLPTRQTITGNISFATVIINQSPILANGVRLGSDAVVNTSLDIRGNGTATANNTLDLSGNLLTLNGNIASTTTSRGTITGSSTSSLTINGTGDAGTLRFTDGNRTLSTLTMNRTSSGRVTLGTPLTLVGGSTALTLTNGIIYTSNTNDNFLTLGAGAGVTGSSNHISGGSNASHIDGPIAKVTTSTNHFAFPTGKLGRLAHIGVKPVSSTSLNPTTFRAEYFRQNPYTSIGSTIKSPLARVSTVEYWMLDRLTTVNPSAANVTLYWDEYTDVSKDPSQWNQLRVAHYKNSQWDTEGPGSGASPETGFSYYYGYLTSDPVSSFSPFTWGSLQHFNPLPVELLDLKAKPDNKVVHINWLTNTEHNSSHFILQRSADGVNFTSIATIKAAGESKTVRNYLYTDKQPHTGINYYRLLQVDKDGSTVTSKIVSANIESVIQGEFEVYPNPSDGKILNLQLDYKGEIAVSVFTITGVEIITQRIMATGGITTIQPKNGLTPGMYIVRVATPQQTYQQKLIVK